MRRAILFGYVPAIAVLLGTVAGHAAAPVFPAMVTSTITSLEAALPIPDNGSLVSILDVGNMPGAIIDVDLTLDLAHTRGDNLDIWLISPSLTTVTLTSDNGGANDNIFAGTTFDDQAPGVPSATNVRNFVYTDQIATGTIQPEEALGALVGEPAEGAWALVVVDDAGGDVGTLRSWSLTISMVPGVVPSAPVAFPGAGGAIPNNPTGLVSTVVVSGVGQRLYDVNVTLDIAPHPNADDLDLFLTSPGGKRIDLVTDVGGGNDDLYAGTVFDDGAGLSVGDTLPLPPSGTAFTRVAGEGALAAFLGEDPNGTWILTAVDDTAGNTGTLRGWTLTVVTTSVCGDGVTDAGEACDDGNRVEGDGCDSNCTQTVCGNGIQTAGEACDDGNTQDGDGCPGSCRNDVANCDACADGDLNGFLDATDPTCARGALALRSGAIVFPAGKVKLAAGLPVSQFPAGEVSLVVVGPNSTGLCTNLGALRGGRGGTFVARGTVGSGIVSIKVTTKRGGRVTIKGRGLDWADLDDPNLTIALRLGGERFITGGAFRGRGPSRWVYP